MTEAMPQAISAAGPAMVSAVKPAKSHPEPMMDPSEAHSRPRIPTSRFRPSAPESRIAQCLRRI